MDPETLEGLFVTIAGGIQSLLSNNATQKWQQATSDQLNEIIQQNAQILTELQNLELQIPADLVAAFDEEITHQSNALIADFTQDMAQNPPDLASVTTLNPQAQTLANNIADRGPCVYQAAGAATLLVLAIYKVLNVTLANQKPFIDAMIAAMTNWASNSPGMFGDAINKAQSTLAQKKAVLAAEPRGQVSIDLIPTEVDIGGQGARPLPPINITLQVMATVTIDDNALTGTVTNAFSTTAPGGTHIDQGTINAAVTSWQQRIQAEISAIEFPQSNLTILQQHKAALQEMIAGLQAWQ